MVIGLIFLVTYPANIVIVEIINREKANPHSPVRRTLVLATSHLYLSICTLRRTLDCWLSRIHVLAILHTAPLYPITPSYLIYRHTLTFASSMSYPRFTLTNLQSTLVLAAQHPYLPIQRTPCVSYVVSYMMERHHAIP